MDRPGHSEQKPSTSVSSAFEPTRRVFSSDSDSESVVSDLPPVDIYVEEGELSDEKDTTITNLDQSLSEEQSYRETGPTWDRHISQILTPMQALQMTTHLLALNCKPQARCRYSYLQMSGYVGN